MSRSYTSGFTRFLIFCIGPCIVLTVAGQYLLGNIGAVLGLLLGMTVGIYIYERK